MHAHGKKEIKAIVNMSATEPTQSHKLKDNRSNITPYLLHSCNEIEHHIRTRYIVYRHLNV